MKIRAEITAAETNGEALKITLQGKEVGAADWRGYLAITMQVPQSRRTERAYHVGRSIEINLAPQKNKAGQ